MKRIFTLQWFKDNNCVIQGQEYLDTKEWKVDFPKDDFDLFLSQNLVAKQQNLAAV